MPNYNAENCPWMQLSASSSCCTRPDTRLFRTATRGAFPAAHEIGNSSSAIASPAFPQPQLQERNEGAGHTKRPARRGHNTPRTIPGRHSPPGGGGEARSLPCPALPGAPVPPASPPPPRRCSAAASPWAPWAAPWPRRPRGPAAAPAGRSRPLPAPPAPGSGCAAPAFRRLCVPGGEGGKEGGKGREGLPLF